MHKKNKKWLNKFEPFCQQIRRSLYFICIVCQWCFYKCTASSFEHEKYHILTIELYCPVRAFEENIYICNSCHKHLSKNGMLCQKVFNKMSLDPIPDELNDLKSLS